MTIIERALSSPWELAKFTRDSQSLKEVRAAAHSGKAPLAHRVSLLKGMAIIGMIPLIEIYRLFLHAVGAVMHHLVSREWGGYFSLMADHQRLAWARDIGGCDSPDNFPPGSAYRKELEAHRLLAPTMNVASLKAVPTYAQPPIPLGALHRDIRKLVHRDLEKQGKLTFAENPGHCDGMSRWFAYLYSKTKYDFRDPETHLRTVAEQFFDGAPTEAVVHQALNGNFPTIDSMGFLHRKIAYVRCADTYDRWYRLEGWPVFSYEKLCSVLERSSAEMMWIAGTSKAKEVGHAMLLIKRNGKLYFFDPNHGLFLTSPSALAKKLAEDFDRFIWIEQLT